MFKIICVCGGKKSAFVVQCVCVRVCGVCVCVCVLLVGRGNTEGT